MTSYALLTLAHQSEDTASGLTIFRDTLVEDGPWITAVIAELFAVSAAIRELDGAWVQGPSATAFLRLREDVHLVCSSVHRTLDDLLAMFGKTARRSHQSVWDDLNSRMETVEHVGLVDRLKLYAEFFRGLRDAIEDGRPALDVELRRQSLEGLLHAQNQVTIRDTLLADSPDTAFAQVGHVPPSAAHERRRSSPIGHRSPRRQYSASIQRPTTASRPRPISSGRRWSSSYFVAGALPAAYTFIDGGREPIAYSSDMLAPLSPTLTAASSRSLNSSQSSSSYSRLGVSGATARPALFPTHWARNIFNGSHPLSQFRASHSVNDRTACFGTVDMSSLTRLLEDGFVDVLELSFDDEAVRIRLCWRPQDWRARILFMTQDSHYCVPLTSLKVIRRKSCLELCRARTHGRYVLWARLNFAFYERMVLFYSTFVAMKRQDTRLIDHPRLLDHFELREVEEFGGRIQHGHALRLFRDRGSDVVRLEASALQGPMQDVPIWSAFIDRRYLHDPDHFHYERAGIVSIAALRPPPYVFVDNYLPPQNQDGEFELRFATSEGK